MITLINIEGPGVLQGLNQAGASHVEILDTKIWEVGEATQEVGLTGNADEFLCYHDNMGPVHVRDQWKIGCGTNGYSIELKIDYKSKKFYTKKGLFKNCVISCIGFNWMLK